MTSGIHHSSARIKRIFIANRGEIARRIALTAQKLGIQTVAITDRLVAPGFLTGIVTDFVHVKEENTALYLNPKLMIEHAKAAGCDAVHPGFGFLSENSEFADAIIQSGLTWIGPRPGAIDAMASKATARNHAQHAQVPCLPGLNGLDLSHGEAKALAQLEEFAAQTGFPILLKAAYGGGGKGMRIVHQKSELAENAKRAASEALSSFGNGSLIVEKYLPAPRHVEVQVLADKHGNVSIVGDRDCSLQRRHQKILEEAPAPEIPDSIRHAMHSAAKSLTAAVGYDNAGTVEFLLDETTPAKIGFYFLEMNTRLQVEHTVSEEVFGIDLVEWQIRVAQGETLPVEFANLKPRGHSIEVRIYAEDPGTNFFPAPGPVRAFVPAQGRGVRWEIGMDTVDEITSKFDPMISKLVCTAGDRKQALELLAQTLERTLFAGPRNNIQFLTWLARHPDVVKRPVDTHFIAAHVDEALAWEAANRKQHEPIVQSLLDALEGRRVGTPGSTAHHHLTHSDAKSVTASAFAKTALGPKLEAIPLSIHVTQKNLSWSPIDPQAVSRYGFGLYDRGDHKSHAFGFVVHQAPLLTEHWISLGGHNWVRADERASSAGSGSGSTQGDGMTAPVPGKVIAINIKAGDVAEAGQMLFILESMKMQFEVKSTKAGEVSKILVEQGMQVTAGQKLGDWV